MSVEPTLDAQILRPIRTNIQLLGAPIDRLLAESQLPPPDDPLESGEVSEVRVWDFFHRSARALDLPLVGHLTGQSIEARDLGSFGRQLEHRLTVRDCLEFYVRQVNAHSSHSRNWFEVEGDGLWFCRGRVDLLDVGRDYVEQFVLQLMIRVVQLGTHCSDWHPIRAKVETSDPDFYRDVAAFHSTDIQYNHPYTAIWIPSFLLGHVLRRDQSDRFLRDVRERLSLCLAQTPRIEVTAQSAGVSKRTLQRTLASNDLTWKQLVDQVRLDAAISLLMSPNIPVVEISEHLGYTDASNFARAFARWTGVAPQVYRAEFLNAR